VSFLRSDVSEVRAKKERAGFTLVEVIVVIVIIAILAAIGVPALTGYIDKAQDKQYITKARDFAIATRTVIDEAYADGDFSDPKGLMYYNPDFLETSFSPKSNFKVWEIFAVSEFIYNDSARFAYRIADLQGDEDLIYFCEAGGQRLYIAGSLDSNIFNADGFLWMYSPEEIITYNDGVGGDPASFIIVTYKLTRANSLDVDITEENKNKFEPWNMAHLITNEAEYDPDAGYEVYHGHYSGAVY
jgi:prepilin-type N-terminal cleavage/methylation domain-containing protein